MGRVRAKADGGLTEAALQYLATQQDVWAERRNSGFKLVPKKGGGFYRIWLGEPGTPDICGLLRRRALLVEGTLPPTYFGIETKTTVGRLTAAQKTFHEKAMHWGMCILVARSIGEVRAFIRSLR